MSYNIRSGRLRHQVSIYAPSTGDTDDYGRPLVPTKLFDRRAEVQVKSGAEAEKYGTVITSTVLTVLMWYDPQIKYEHTLEWNGAMYTIKHIRPDSMNREMIITAEVEV